MLAFGGGITATMPAVKSSQPIPARTRRPPGAIIYALQLFNLRRAGFPIPAWYWYGERLPFTRAGGGCPLGAEKPPYGRPESGSDAPTPFGTPVSTSRPNQRGLLSPG